MMQKIRLLILSDLHYNYYGRSWEREGGQNGRIFTGSHMLRAFDAVLNEKSNEVDHVIIAGDLTNHGNDYEYAPVSNAVSSFTPDKLSIVPGNHDMSTNLIKNLSRREFRKRFTRFFGRFAQAGRERKDVDPFPYVKKPREGITIIGLDTTAPILERYRNTPIGFSPSVGAIGDEQLRKLGNTLKSLPEKDHWIIIVMHHDPFVRQNPWTRLGDLAKFKRLVLSASEKKKIVVVCGHNHNGRIDHYGKNVLHIQAPAFCGRRTTSKGLYYDITLNDDLSYELNL
ncbi:MAG TPA: metallophosphoesterase [bacterium]|nr:metallophosphoesterase [bacterium]